MIYRYTNFEQFHASAYDGTMGAKRALQVARLAPGIEQHIDTEALYFTGAELQMKATMLAYSYR